VPCGLLGAAFALLVLCVPALAAAPEAPETKPASAVTATSAVVHGVLDANAASPELVVEYDFFFAPRGAACTEGFVAPEAPGIATGAKGEKVEAALAGLEPDMEYAVCVATRNPGEAEWTVGSSVSFTTEPAAPQVDGESVSAVSPDEATLEAQVNANNEETTYSFEDATSEAAIGTPGATTVTGASALSGFGPQTASVSTGALLTQVTTYYYRVRAENAQSKKEGKPVEGAIEHFKTPLEAPTTSPAPVVTSTTATLHGVLNPDATGEAGSYEFRYRASGSECQGEGELATPQGSMTGVKEQGVEAEVTGLEPGKQYTFCLFAKDTAEETAIGAPVTFRALADPPVITETNATQVTATSATLGAQIDPGGAETSYHFDYGTTASYGQSTPESAPLAPDDTNHPLAAAVQGLQPATTYHYRVVARNTIATLQGPDETYTTSPTGEAFALPDGRQYELVSSPEKSGANTLGLFATTFSSRAPGAPGGSTAVQASEDGTAVTYLSAAPVGPNPPGGDYGTQVLSRRGAGGWTSQDITNPHTNTNGFFSDLGEEYRLFASDLSRALVQSASRYAEPPLTPEIHEEIQPKAEIYLRENSIGAIKALIPDPPEVGFDEAPEVEGGNGDFSAVVFRSQNTLYTSSGGQAQVVDVLPNGEVDAGGVLGARIRDGVGDLTNGSVGRNPISSNGTHIVWSDGSGVFTRDMAEERSIEVTAPQGGSGAAGGGEFQAASNDGSHVFFTDGNELTAGAHAGDLYEYDLSKPLGARLTDLTPQFTGGTPNVLGKLNVLAADEHGTSIYVTAPAVLTSGPNSENEVARPCPEEPATVEVPAYIFSCNLYVLRESAVGNGHWSTTFIATLSPADVRAYFKESLGTDPLDGGRILNAAVRVSANGRFFAFMSNRSLTGYDNHDANSGQPDEEVYLYNVEANSLVCASCNPTGARPVGVLDPGADGVEAPLAIDATFTWEGMWVAAVMPGANYAAPVNSGFLEKSLYQSRVLSEAGRLFFNAVDSLVSADVNGKPDVYEYEPDGVGSCGGATGCVALISAGKSRDESSFVDASASGNDVFLITTERLVSQDQDNLADMYDARVCTTAEPCPQSAPLSPPPCSTADGCRAAQSPQPGVFGAPASATFVGPGNAAPTPTTTVTPKPKPKPKPKKCKKGFTKRHGRCVRAKKKAHKSAIINRRAR
jgi:hypothetical protein